MVAWVSLGTHGTLKPLANKKSIENTKINH